jgi:hypothetical protein
VHGGQPQQDAVHGAHPHLDARRRDRYPLQSATIHPRSVQAAVVDKYPAPTHTFQHSVMASHSLIVDSDFCAAATTDDPLLARCKGQSPASDLDRQHRPWVIAALVHAGSLHPARTTKNPNPAFSLGSRGAGAATPLHQPPGGPTTLVQLTRST